MKISVMITKVLKQNANKPYITWVIPSHQTDSPQVPTNVVIPADVGTPMCGVLWSGTQCGPGWHCSHCQPYPQHPPPWHPFQGPLPGRPVGTWWAEAVHPQTWLILLWWWAKLQGWWILSLKVCILIRIWCLYTKPLPDGLLKKVILYYNWRTTDTSKLCND